MAFNNGSHYADYHWADNHVVKAIAATRCSGAGGGCPAAAASASRRGTRDTTRDACPAPISQTLVSIPLPHTLSLVSERGTACYAIHVRLAKEVASHLYTERLGYTVVYAQGHCCLPCILILST